MSMSIKNSVLLVLVTVVFGACSATKNDGMISVTGKIKNPIPQGEIILEKFEVGQMVTVNTVNADDNGDFEIKAEVNEPGFYRINVYGQQFEMLVLNKDNITIEADGQGGEFIEAKGSEDLVNLNKVLDYMGAYSQVVKDFNQRYSRAQQAGDNLQMEELMAEGTALEAEKVKKLKIRPLR